MITWTAQYLLFVLAAVFALVWLVAEDRRGRIFLAIAAVFATLASLNFIVAVLVEKPDAQPASA